MVGFKPLVYSFICSSTSTRRLLLTSIGDMVFPNGILFCSQLWLIAIFVQNGDLGVLKPLGVD